MQGYKYNKGIYVAFVGDCPTSNIKRFNPRVSEISGKNIDNQSQDIDILKIRDETFCIIGQDNFIIYRYDMLNLLVFFIRETIACYDLIIVLL